MSVQQTLALPGAPVKAPRYNRLPMSWPHVGKVVTGQKRKTLRSFPVQGEAIFLLGKSDYLVRVWLDPMGQICWTELRDTDKLDIANDEGYRTIGAFEAAADYFYPGFTQGHTKLWLHRIEVVK